MSAVEARECLQWKSRLPARLSRHQRSYEVEEKKKKKYLGGRSKAEEEEEEENKSCWAVEKREEDEEEEVEQEEDGEERLGEVRGFSCSPILIACCARRAGEDVWESSRTVGLPSGAIVLLCRPSLPSSLKKDEGGGGGGGGRDLREQERKRSIATLVRRERARHR